MDKENESVPDRHEAAASSSAETDVPTTSTPELSDVESMEFLFLHNIDRFRQRCDNTSDAVSVKRLHYFDMLKAVVPNHNNNVVATRVLKCKTEEDFQMTLDNFLQPFPCYDANYLERHKRNHVANNPSSETSPSTETEDAILMRTCVLLDMFPDADPDYIKRRVRKLNGEQEEGDLASELSSAKKNHPAFKNYLKRKNDNEMRQKFLNGMDIEEFEEYFNGTEHVFGDKTRTTSELYKLNSASQIKNDFLFHTKSDIRQILQSQNYKYVLSFNWLLSMSPTRQTPRAMVEPQIELDDDFIKERCYVRMVDKINYQKKEMQEKKQKLFEEAKTSGELRECQCCYEDEILISNMSPCNGEAAHLFCNNCIRRYSEEQIGQAKLEFFCLNGECTSSFNLKVLESVLKPCIFSNLLKRMQAQEIAAADIPDLVSCPFCNFAAIMTNPEDKVFKCLNPECQKDSCRLCKKSNHIPLQCAEIERQKQNDHRTYLENEMTKAILRECYNCKKSFLKEDGCNKMTCSCGAIMCYLCKAPITGYDHFTDNSMAAADNRCPLWSDSCQIHANELQTRVEELRTANTISDPEVHNPLDDPIPEVPQNRDFPLILADEEAIIMPPFIFEYFPPN